jgi:dolichyl-phosphate-mannose--protein O-mannosyl transferase
MTLAFFGALWGYDQSKCDYEPPPGSPRSYAADCEFWKLRCISAAFSIGACLLMYFIARRLGASPAGSALACLLEVFNILHNVEGRLVLLNSQLIFWLNVTLYFGLLWLARLSRGGLSLAERLGWAAGVGFLAGCAFCIKHTGLGTPGLLGLEAALGLFFLSRPAPLLDLLAYVASMFFTYAGWFALHFHNMQLSHGTLRQEEEFMSANFQSLLKGSSTYSASAVSTESFWHTFFTFNKRMVDHSAAITQPHAWGSRPWQWVLNLKGVSYWGNTMGTAEDGSAIYLFSNPFSNGAILAALALLLLCSIVWQRSRLFPEAAAAPQLASKGAGSLLQAVLAGFLSEWGSVAAAASFCLLGWAVNLAPYSFINRTTFSYHYMPAQVYGHLLAALLVDRFLSEPGVLLTALGSAGTWLYFSPWIFCVKISPEAHAKRRWLESWV